MKAHFFFPLSPQGMGLCRGLFIILNFIRINVTLNRRPIMIVTFTGNDLPHKIIMVTSAQTAGTPNGRLFIIVILTGSGTTHENIVVVCTEAAAAHRRPLAIRTFGRVTRKERHVAWRSIGEIGVRGASTHLTLTCSPPSVEERMDLRTNWIIWWGSHDRGRKRVGSHLLHH
jgi:hypothetical protein